MQLRMLARRARHHSMTVLGDLAQATGPASPSTWELTLAHLGRPPNAQMSELTIGYRLPGAFLALANRLLPLAAPGVTAARSVRADGDPPDLHACTPEELVGAVAEHALVLASAFASVAVIAAPARVDELRAALAVDAEGPLVVLPPALAKGLEFDAVIVVEPAEIASEEPHGVRLLFVALTRAVQHLALAHTGALPDVLQGTMR
jgi:DNA helicase IV